MVSLAITRRPNLRRNTHLQPRILLHHVANFREQVRSTQYPERIKKGAEKTFSAPFSMIRVCDFAFTVGINK